MFAALSSSVPLPVAVPCSSGMGRLRPSMKTAKNSAIHSSLTRSGANLPSRTRAMPRPSPAHLSRTHFRLPKMFSEESSDPRRDVLPVFGAADSLCSGLSACDMLSITESLTEDSESLADSVPLTDS